ncbi:Myosin-VIIa, partial [Orchesella cincta]
AVCRGFLVRQQCVRKRLAVLTLQSHIRRMIAQKKFKLIKFEALQLREQKENACEDMLDWKDCTINPNPDDPEEDLLLLEDLSDSLPDNTSKTSSSGVWKFAKTSEACRTFYIPPELQPADIEDFIQDLKLKSSLLPLAHPADQLAAQALWITILRFLGDLPEPRYHSMERDTTSVMSKVTATLGRNFATSKEFQDMDLNNIDEYNLTRTPKSTLNKLVSLTLKRKNKLDEDVRRRLEGDDAADSYQSWLESGPTSNLEKLHFIIGHGILRTELRFIHNARNYKLYGNLLYSPNTLIYIYLDTSARYTVRFVNSTNNPSNSSHARGWILLSLCVGCFAPSDRFVKHLRAFIREGPPGYAPYCEDRLKRTFNNGTRNQPPSWLELQKPIILPITFMDGNTKNLLADSATTSRELCNQLAEKIGLRDQFGFITGSGNEHVMDAISQCEQYCSSRNAPWRLFFRKYYVDYGTELHSDKLNSAMTSYIPDFCLNSSDKSPERWTQLVTTAFRRSLHTRERADLLRVKEDIVAYAKFKWPLLFSRFYEAYRYAGPNLPKNDVILAINWTGVYVVDDQEQVLLELSFPEITHIRAEKSDKIFGQTFTLSTVRPGEEFTFQSPNAEDIRELVDFFLDGLKKRSTLCIAMQDYKTPDKGSNFFLLKGDLIVLEGDINGETVMTSGWCVGRCERTGEKGSLPAEMVYVLPATCKPSPDILELFKTENGRKKNFHPDTTGFTTFKEEPHTLEKFAIEHFRQYPKETTSKSVSSVQDELWRHSREPLLQPLLKKLQNKEGLRSKIGNELADQIFDAPLKHEILRDEVYCQFMKQLTDNRNKFSEERGWELMWLATGLFTCSQTLLNELTQFLRTRRHPVAQDSLQRLRKTLKVGQRKYPPHQVEVEAIQHKTTQIFHKVYFPDDMDEAFEVDSSTRAKEFCANIAERLALRSAEGFSLFVKIADKIISVPEGEIFFDFVRHLTDWIKRDRPTRDGTIPKFTYQVFFLRKLWTNVKPGQDPIADSIFHYHQELPKYLMEEASKLAALVYRVRLIDQLLRELIPLDLAKLRSPNDWNRAIAAAYNQDAVINIHILVLLALRVACAECDSMFMCGSDYMPQYGLQLLNSFLEDAKQNFLKRIYRWPTFGSAFFEVKQTSDTSFPELLLIAINKQGVSFIHPQTKEILVTYPFTKVSNWSSENTYFRMTIGNDLTFLCETSLGYKMDEMLTSYISIMIASMNEKRALRDK